MKFGKESIAREIYFFKNQAGDEARKLVLTLFLFFKKALYKEVKDSSIFGVLVVLHLDIQ